MTVIAAANEKLAATRKELIEIITDNAEVSDAHSASNSNEPQLPGNTEEDSSDLLTIHQRLDDAEQALCAIHLSFDAAEFEGILNAIDNGDQAAVADIWNRRINQAKEIASIWHSRH